MVTLIMPYLIPALTPAPVWELRNESSGSMSTLVVVLVEVLLQWEKEVEDEEGWGWGGCLDVFFVVCVLV